jgi:predicted nucleotidyltransferase
VRFTAPLDDALATRGHVRILRALDGLPVGLPASARDLARRAGVAHNRGSEILANLSAQGLTDVQRVGRSDLYQLNREHALLPLVQRLFAEERTLQRELELFLRRRIRALAPTVQEAYIFGSVARRESRIGSDIDLALVAPRSALRAGDAALTQLAREVRRRFGSELSVHLSAESLFDRVKHPAGRALWKRIEAEGVRLIPARA